MLTPVDASLRPDAAKALPYYGELLDGGCDGINVLGTTGQAPSFGCEERLNLMQGVAAALPPERCMAGGGAATFGDTVCLTKAAFDLQFAAALVLPPAYLRENERSLDDAVMSFFEALLERTGSGPILLYNFPRLSGIAFSPALVRRLLRAFPESIAGIKDSANDRDLQRRLSLQHPDFAVFPSSEAYLRDAVCAGAVGCISGSVALWPRLAQAVYRTGDQRAAEELARRRRAVEGDALITNVRRAVAEQRNDDSWLRSPF